MEEEIKRLEKRVEKLEDELQSYNDKMTAILNSVTRIEEKLEGRRTENNLSAQIQEQKIIDVGKRVTKLEDSQSWIIKAIVGEVIAIVFMIIKAFIQKGI